VAGLAYNAAGVAVVLAQHLADLGVVQFSLPQLLHDRRLLEALAALPRPAAPLVRRLAPDGCRWPSADAVQGHGEGWGSARLQPLAVVLEQAIWTLWSTRAVLAPAEAAWTVALTGRTPPIGHLYFYRVARP
jgi:hypothetical protein